MPTSPHDRHGMSVPPVEGRNRCGGERSQPIHYKQTRSQTGHSKTATKPPLNSEAARLMEKLEKLKSIVNALQNPNKDFCRPAFPRGRGHGRGRRRPFPKERALSRLRLHHTLPRKKAKLNKRLAKSNISSPRQLIICRSIKH